MKKINYFEILIFSYGLSSCSSGQLQINSQPDNAEVYISSLSGPTKKVGVTPLTQNESMLTNTNEPYQITISKSGYEDSHTLVPATTLTRNVALSVKLQEIASNKPQSNSEIDKIASQVAEVQNLIKTRNLPQAERNILILLSQHPNVATFHELLGNIYYLKKDTQNALASYKKANELVPGNPDTMRMINKLQIFGSETKVSQ
jgi:tetratricopeptide (TPR) repeat protein